MPHTTTLPVILTDAADTDDVLHTVEFDVQDDTIYALDDADGHITVMAWPVERVPAICAAMMRAVGR